MSDEEHTTEDKEDAFTMKFKNNKSSVWHVLRKYFISRKPFFPKQEDADQNQDDTTN